MAGGNEAEFGFDHLYWMAALSLHHDRGRISTPVYHQILHHTLTETRIDEAAFRAYVDSHREDLERTLEAEGF